MDNNQLFAGTPVLSLITNFSRSGDFEKIYMVMGHLPERTGSNRMRQPSSQKTNSFWNGPGEKQER
jgi:hypothetical protein